jgi:hypothetical protein
MSRTWQVSPPYPAFRAYAPWLADYAQQRLALPEHRLPAGTSFANWFRQHEPALRKDARHRDWNAIIAAQLLSIFEAEPEGWEAVTFLNRGSSNGQESLAQHFAQWRANCPDHLRPFVSKLAAVLGVRFRPNRPFAASPIRLYPPTPSLSSSATCRGLRPVFCSTCSRQLNPSVTTRVSGSASRTAGNRTRSPSAWETLN